MKLEHQVSSLEPSKKLKELGVKQESLHAYFYCYEITGYSWRLFYDGTPDGMNERVAAFTVAELGEMLPHHVNYWHFEVRKYSSDPTWWCGYYQEGLSGKFESSCYEFESESDSLADCLAKMLIHLIEKGIIKP